MIGQISSKFTELETRPIIQYGFLAAITLLAAALRFYKLGEWSFWIDEIFTVNRAQAHYSTIENVIRNIPPTQNWIPLSVMLTAGVINHLGVNEWNARLIPAIIGILSIPMLYFPIKRVFNPGVSLLAVLLLAVSPWHIYWSQNARFFTSLMLLYTMAMFAFFFGLERDRIVYILLFIFLTYFAASERLLALFIVPVVAGYMLLLKILPFEKPSGLRARNLALIILPGIALSIVEIYSIQSTGISRFFGGFSFFINSIENPFTQATFIVFEIGIPLVTLAFFSGLLLLLKKSRAGLLVFLGAVVPFALVLLATPFLFTEERYTFVTLPCWLILGAIAVKEIFEQTRNSAKLLSVGIFILLLADAAGANLMYFRVNNGNRRDYKGAFALVQERSGDDDIIVSTWPQIGAYYLGQEVISWQDTGPDAVIQSDKRVWFVIVPDMAWVWNSQRFLWWVQKNCELIDVRYLRRPDNANILIYLCDPARGTILEKSK